MIYASSQKADRRFARYVNRAAQLGFAMPLRQDAKAEKEEGGGGRGGGEEDEGGGEGGEERKGGE